MKALKVLEAYNFQRGQNPKRSLSLGKFNSPLYRALTDPDNEVNGEGFNDWMETNPTLAKAIEYNKNPLPLDQYLTFDLDYYCENNDIDPDDLKDDFDSKEIFSRLKPGELMVFRGIIKSLPDQNKVLYYRGGNIDGFITRKDWVGIR